MNPKDSGRWTADGDEDSEGWHAAAAPAPERNVTDAPAGGRRPSSPARRRAALLQSIVDAPPRLDGRTAECAYGSFI